ncbi:hypothetical protein GF385_02775 [Candidatus Dependentiae bacterium]|nr:hypothetical protein [Candidatus Dependentiae bacterium]
MFLLKIIFISLFFYVDLFSYIDPGSGSFLIQLLIAFFAGSLFFAKSFFRKIKGFVFKKNKDIEKD